MRRSARCRLPPPFNTSTLQQQASIQLHFSAKKTMFLAQRLYEGVELGPEGAVGLITYMRTDSLHVADQAVGECRDFISKRFPKEYLPEKALFYKSSKAAQGAHEAIRPTSAERTPESVKPFLEPDQFRLYDLIWRRFVASQMTPGRLAVTDVEIAAGRATFEVARPSPPFRRPSEAHRLRPENRSPPAAASRRTTR